eukprot:jgi/Tetstr1/430133/TSEL_019966.t1
MEWSFTVHGLGNQLVSRWDSRRICGLPLDQQEKLRQVIDRAGFLSAKAQGLGAVITDMARMRSSGHTLYLAATTVAGTTEVQGLLKVGYKKLFIRSESGSYSEITPLCVLDFYVHESCQRVGLGGQLMSAMLHDVKLPPHAFGYDRPSPKLMHFLKKHYGLADYVPQSNNFVVFRQYFSNLSAARRTHNEQGTAASGCTSATRHPPWHKQQSGAYSADRGADTCDSSACSPLPLRLHTPNSPQALASRDASARRRPGSGAYPADHATPCAGPPASNAGHVTAGSVAAGGARPAAAAPPLGCTNSSKSGAHLSPHEQHALPAEEQDQPPADSDPAKPRYGRRAKPGAPLGGAYVVPIQRGVASPVPLQYQAMWGGHGQGRAAVAEPQLPCRIAPMEVASRNRGGPKVADSPHSFSAARMETAPPVHPHTACDYHGSPKQPLSPGFPPPPAGMSVTPAKAMALRQRAGMGAKNALAW